VFHWHLTDSQSFPLQLEKFGDTTGKMAQFGAYGANKVYTVGQVKELVEFANKRGAHPYYQGGLLRSSRATIVPVLMMLPKIVLRTFYDIFCRCTIKRQLNVKKVPINNARNSQKKVPKDNFGKHHQNQHNYSTLVVAFLWHNFFSCRCSNRA
jgi:hypothetical protein